MPQEKSNAEPTFGFLSTLESSDYGLFGGYLIVSPLGRPVEFHCTSPVRPSRAQEILYGPTLQPYLIGEQISGALLKAAKTRPCLILVDGEAMLVARALANSPMAMIAERANVNFKSFDAETAGEQPRFEVASSGPRSFGRRSDAQINAGDYSLVLPNGFEAEQHVVAELAMQLSQHVDLAEPFGRIHEAIREAQRIGERTESQSQAA